MGILSSLFSGGGRRYNNMAKAMSLIIANLDRYEYTHDDELLMASAWVCRIGLLDAIESHSFAMTAPIWLTINGHNTKMILSEAILKSYGRLETKIEDLDHDGMAFCKEILAKGNAFYVIDRQIPYENKREFAVD